MLPVAIIYLHYLAISTVPQHFQILATPLVLIANILYLKQQADEKNGEN